MFEDKPTKDENSQEESQGEKVKRLRALLLGKQREAIMSDNPDAVNEKIAEFTNDLKARYSHKALEDYALYNNLIWSTPPKEPTKLDLPGDDSVEKFIESL